MIFEHPEEESKESKIEEKEEKEYKPMFKDKWDDY